MQFELFYIVNNPDHTSKCSRDHNFTILAQGNTFVKYPFRVGILENFFFFKLKKKKKKKTIITKGVFWLQKKSSFRGCLEKQIILDCPPPRLSPITLIPTEPVHLCLVFNGWAYQISYWLAWLVLLYDIISPRKSPNTKDVFLSFFSSNFIDVYLFKVHLWLATILKSHQQFSLIYSSNVFTTHLQVFQYPHWHLFNEANA